MQTCLAWGAHRDARGWEVGGWWLSGISRCALRRANTWHWQAEYGPSSYTGTAAKQRQHASLALGELNQHPVGVLTPCVPCHISEEAAGRRAAYKSNLCTQWMWQSDMIQGRCQRVDPPLCLLPEKLRIMLESSRLLLLCCVHSFSLWAIKSCSHVSRTDPHNTVHVLTTFSLLCA